MPPIPLQRTLAIGSLVYAATLWGLMWYPYRLLNEAGVGGIASSFFTYAVPLLAFGWLHGREFHHARGKWIWLAALGLAAGWTNLAYVLAMLQGEVVRVLLLFFLSPLWTVVLARFLLHEKLNRAGRAVMVLAAGGAMVMLWQPEGGLPLPANRAEWLALSAGMMFALSNVISRRLGGVPEGVKSVSVWVGVVVLTVAGLWFYPGELDFVEGVEWSAWLLLLGIGLFIGSMTYAVQYGLARVPANQAIVIFLFELVVAAVAAYFLSEERMGLQEWTGAIMIVTASLFSGHMEASSQGFATGSKETSRELRSCSCCGGVPDSIQSTDRSARYEKKIWKCLEEVSSETIHAPYRVITVFKCRVCGIHWHYEMWGIGHRDYDWKLTVCLEGRLDDKGEL